MHVDINSYVLEPKPPLVPCRGYEGDGHQPNSTVGFYIPIIRIPVIKGGTSLSPKRRSFDPH